MAEYMDYNDAYGDYKSVWQKRRANLVVIISAVFLVSIAVWAVVNRPENIRTRFDTVRSNTYALADIVPDEPIEVQSEFLSFFENFELDEEIPFNEEFRENFPQISDLFYTSKVDISQEVIQTFDRYNVFTIARVYVVNRLRDAGGDYMDRNVDYIYGDIGIDFTMLPFSTGTEGFTVYAPQRRSLRFSRIPDRPQTVSPVHVSSDRFRLNFYHLSVLVETEENINRLPVTMSLLHGINLREYENNFFLRNVSIRNVDNGEYAVTPALLSGGTRGDRYLDWNFNLNTETAYAKVRVNFTDVFYNKFGSLRVLAPAGAMYTLVVN